MSSRSNSPKPVVPSSDLEHVMRAEGSWDALTDLANLNTILIYLNAIASYIFSQRYVGLLSRDQFLIYFSKPKLKQRTQEMEDTSKPLILS